MSLRTSSLGGLALLGCLSTASLLAAPALQLEARPVGGGRVAIGWSTTPAGVYTLLVARGLSEPWVPWLVVQASGPRHTTSVTALERSGFYRVLEGALEPPGPQPAQLVWMPPGTFLMGSPASEVGRDGDEEPVTTTTISHGFWIGRHEVTQEEYQSLIGVNPSAYKTNPQRPVDMVTWPEAVAYCRKLTDQARAQGVLPEGYTYRLPTEAEWEYACRAGTTTRFHYGDDPAYAQTGEFAWFAPNSGWSPQPVALKRPSPWDLFDLHGNVYEWCQDWYEDRLPGGEVVDPQGPASGWVRATRGGAWYNSGWRIRSAFRSYFWPDYRSYNGIRPVLAPERTPSAAVSADPLASRDGPPPEAVASASQAASAPLDPVGPPAAAAEEVEPANPDPDRLAWVPSGTFLMGSPVTELHRAGEPMHQEGPQTRVTLTRGFWMRRLAVTQRDFQQLMGNNPSFFGGRPDHPVEQVTWWEATNYCGRLTALERQAGRVPAGYVYRLPTEAERQYACRAGTTTRFSYGDDLTYAALGEYAWYYDNSGNTTHPVGRKQPNPWGLYDMHGNVREWTLDWFGLYPGGEVVDYVGPRLGKYRTPVSGGWTQGAGACRSASREPHDPDYRSNHVGFRPVLAPEGWPDPAGRW